MTSPEGLSLLKALLEAGAISRDDLGAAAAAPPPFMTHSGYLPTIVARCPPRSLSTYQTNFRRLATNFGPVSLGGVTTADLEVLARRIREAAADNRGGGTGAECGFIHAARYWYRNSVADGYRADNPAAGLLMPRRPRRVRRALDDQELDDLYSVVATGSRDPDLDVLLLDFHRETGARRAGAVNLTLPDLNLARNSVILREKYGHEREIPASPQLLRRIRTLAEARADDLRGPAFRSRQGSPLSRRRYNTIFEQAQARLPWAARLGVSIHWLRHTTLTDVARATNSRVAAAYAGHSDRSVTDLYTVPTFEDLVVAHDLVFPAFRAAKAPRRFHSDT